MTFRPFSDGSDIVEVAGLSVEDRGDRVSLYGSMEITRSLRGLKDAELLLSMMERIVHKLQATPGLPAEPEALQPPVIVNNPLA